MKDKLELENKIVENFATQFKNACFPVWIVNLNLDILYINGNGQNFLKSIGFQMDLKNIMTHEDILDATQRISQGESFRKNVIVSHSTESELAFSPFFYNNKYMGSYIFCVPKNKPQTDLEIIDHVRSELNDNKHFFASESLKRTVTDILYSVNVSADKLKKLNIHDTDLHLSSIVSNCYSILRTSNNLQLFSHISPPMSTVDFWDSVAELMDACSSILRKDSLKFLYNLPTSTVYVHCNFCNVSNVLMNIISNSYLHSDKMATVTVWGYEENGRVYLEVTDDGPGISKKLEPHIFEPYIHREDQDYQGGGVGLAVSYHLMHQMQGNLSLVPNKNGTTLKLSFPIENTFQSDSCFCSTSMDYLADRYSQLYLGLCEIVSLPPI